MSVQNANTSCTLEEKIQDARFFTEKERVILSDAAQNFVTQTYQGDYDVVVFLDKSARPYSYLFKERWKALYPDSEVPQIRFANIGTEKDKRDYSPYKSNPEDLRKIFGSKQFSGKRILIADDFVFSGLTLKYAKQLFSTAFPESAYVGSGSFYSSLERADLDVKPLPNEGEDHSQIS